MKIVIEIKLGNDAMRTGHEVAEALRKFATTVDALTPEDLKAAEENNWHPHVRDVNGNLAGTLWVKVSR